MSLINSERQLRYTATGDFLKQCILVALSEEGGNDGTGTGPGEMYLE
jgi:hypothetical protein